MSVLSRRSLFAASAATAIAATLRVRPVFAQTPGPFTLPPLPYGYDANEPSIDTLTMQIHHDKHHAAYVNNLNDAAKQYPQLGSMKVEEILARIGEIPETIRTFVRNNAGGHANHSMFWTLMGGKGGAPTGELAAAITSDLGGMDAMKAAFNKAGAGVFGSGWVFVTVTRGGKLAIVTKPNQDTPLLDGGRVLFGNDVWEHAYYLKYQNRRPDYLAAWWNVLDWSKVADRFAAAKAGTLTI